MADAFAGRRSGDAGGRRRRWRARANCPACATGDRCRRRRLAHHLAAPAATADAEPKAGPRPRMPSPPGRRDRGYPGSRSSSSPTAATWPNGAAAQLESLLATLPRDAIWEVELQAAVDDAAGSLPPDKALAYNQWLAERRQSRVEDWLGTRPGGAGVAGAPQPPAARSIPTGGDQRAPPALSWDRATTASRTRLGRAGRRRTCAGACVHPVGSGSTSSQAAERPIATSGRLATLLGPGAARPAAQRQSGRAKVSSFSRSAFSVNSP